MEDRDQYGAQNEIYDDSGSPLINQNTGQQGDGDQASFGLGSDGGGNTNDGDANSISITGSTPIGDDGTASNTGGDDGTPLIGDDGTALNTGGDGDNNNTGAGNQIINEDNNVVGDTGNPGNEIDPSTLQPELITDIPENGVILDGTTPVSIEVVPAIPTDPPGLSNQIINSSSTVVAVPPTDPASNIPSLATFDTYRDNPTRAQYVYLIGLNGVGGWYKDLGQFSPEPIEGNPPPGASTSLTVSQPAPEDINNTDDVPLLETFDTYRDNPTRAQYVYLRTKNGVGGWYMDLGQLGPKPINGQPPAGFTTSIPIDNPPGISPPTDPVNPAMGPRQIPYVTQLKDPDPSNYGTVVLSYDIFGKPSYYRATPKYGWLKLIDPVPDGTPNGDDISNTSSTVDPLPPVGVCAGFTIDADGIPTGLTYGSGPGEYVLYSGITAQVSNYSQFGLIESTRWGNPPYDYYRINSISQISSTVNEQGITVCVFSVNFDRATRNPDTPPGGGPTGDPPTALVSAITVAENSANNPVTLPVSGSAATSINYLTVYREGSTVTSAGTSNILEYLYTPAPNFSGGDRISFRVNGVHGISMYGRVDVTVTPATHIGTPAPFNFLDLGYQEGNTVVEGTSVTITGSPTPFPGEWNMALFADYVSLDPGGSIPPRYQDGLYVVGIKRTRGVTTTTHNIAATPVGTPNSLRVGVQDGDIITPIIRTPFANAGAQTVVTYRMRLSPPGYPDGPGGGYAVVEDTFQVRVQVGDADPDPFDFQNQSGLNISTLVDTNEVTVQGVTVGTPVPVSLKLRTGTSPSYVYVPYGNLLINDGSGYVLAGNTSVVYLGYKIKARVTSPSIYSSTDTYRVNMGIAGHHQFDDFTIETKPVPVGTTPPWFADQTGLNPSQTSDTNSVTFDIAVAGTLTVNNGATIMINGVDTGLSSTVISSGQTVAIRATSSGSFSTPRTFTVTLVVVSSTYIDTFVYTTRSQIASPTYSGDFVNRTGRELSEVVTSNTLTLSAFDGPQTLTLTNNNSDATAVIFQNGNNVGTSASVSAGDTIAIRGTADSNEYYKTTTYTLTCGATTKTWSITTKHNDHMILFDPY